MAKLRLSVAARADLVEIRNFSLAEFGSEVADTYFRGFNQAFALLRERPFAGVTQPELGDHLRCLTQRRHRIFYRVDGDIILIVRIIHHARNARRALGEAPK
jgi:toxin ParE1/3/4